jgi:tryptophan synthase alpha chain
MVKSIHQAFQEAREAGRAALMPYLTLGYPDVETSLAAAEAIAPHCDLMELGVPFSDPLADGPTVQHSTQVALENGVTSRDCLEIVRRLRQRGVEIPIMLLGYYNPILAFGEDAYAEACATAGVNGLIVPDLPPEEGKNLIEALKRYGLDMIYFLAPTSSESRIKAVVEQATGFVYMVAVTGVTGARSRVEDSLQAFVTRVKAQTDLPIAVGFGISTPEHAREVSGFADGVIVGSALINWMDAADDDPVRAGADFVKLLRTGVQRT